MILRCDVGLFELGGLGCLCGNSCFVSLVVCGLSFLFFVGFAWVGFGYYGVCGAGDKVVWVGVLSWV